MLPLFAIISIAPSSGATCTSQTTRASLRKAISHSSDLGTRASLVLVLLCVTHFQQFGLVRRAVFGSLQHRTRGQSLSK